MSFNMNFFNKGLKGIAGLEFMDFQNDNFYKELVKELDNAIDGNMMGIPDKNIYNVIEKYTGFKNIEIHMEQGGNLAIDAAYISPGNLFNSSLAEHYFDFKETTLYKWYEKNKTNMFKGTIDFTKGKVGGSFADLEFNIYINKDLNSFITPSVLEKYNVSYAEALAGFFTHELGHAFGGCAMVHQLVSDNILVKAAINMISRSTNKEEKIAVIKDFKKLTDSEEKDAAELDKLAESNDTTYYVVYLTQLLKKRDLRDAAGMGCRVINSEVIADAYSIRMGCGKALAVGLKSLHVKGNRYLFFANLFWGTFVSVYTFAATGMPIIALAAYIFMFCLLWLFDKLNDSVPTIYNNVYRRFMNMAQEYIQKLKSDDSFTQSQKMEIIKTINQCLDVAKSMKPFFEETAMQRLWGWLMTGKQFKYLDLQYYTQNVTSHGINTLGTEFKDLAGV